MSTHMSTKTQDHYRLRVALMDHGRSLVSGWYALPIDSSFKESITYITFADYRKFQRRRMDHRVVSHIIGSQRLAVNARDHYRPYICRIRMYSWRSPWSEMAHRLSILDEASLGHMGIPISHGYSSVPIFRLDIDQYMVRRPMSQGLPHMPMALLRQPQRGTCQRHNDYW
jgi:hypothetical protein